MKKIIILLFLFISAQIVLAEEIWVNQNLDPNYSFTKIKFINESTGFLIETNAFLKTTDGGKNWREVISLEMFDTHTLVTFDIFEDGNGLIIRASGLYSKTTDYGETWTNYELPSNIYFSRLFALDINTFWLMSITNKYLLFTTDSGENWESVSSNNFPDANYLNDIYFKNHTDGLIATNTGNLYQTTDGGKNWSIKPTGSSEYLLKFFFVDDYYGWIAGLDGTVLRTIDGGNSWEKLPFPSDASTVAMYFVNENEGWITTTFEHDGKIYYTSDGGYNWSLQHHEVPTSSSFSLITNLFFLNRNKGWATGSSGIVLSYDKTSSINDYLPINFSIYPNPSSDIIHINTTALITRSELTDILGRTVFKQSGNVEQISTAGLAPGLYLLKLFTAGGEILTEKVVVR